MSKMGLVLPKLSVSLAAVLRLWTGKRPFIVSLGGGYVFMQIWGADSWVSRAAGIDGTCGRALSLTKCVR